MKDEKHRRDEEYLNAPSPYEDSGLDLTEVIKIIRNRKRLVAGIVITSVMIAYTFCLVKSKTITEAYINLDFAGMDKHQYPDGSLFEMNDLIAPDILDASVKVIKDPDRFKVLSANPRSYMFVDSFIPVEVQAHAKEMKILEKKTLNYLPNQFCIKYSQGFNGPLGNEEQKQVIQSIIFEYRNKFLNGYIKRPLLALDIPEAVIKENDYIDTYEILNSSITNYIGFLDARIHEAGYYRSPRTGQSFVDIKTRLETIRDIDLSGAVSIIYSYSLSKQKGFLLTRTRYRIKEMQKQQEKKEMETSIAQDLLKQVIEKDKRDISSNIQVPGNQPQITVDSATLQKLSQKEYLSMLIGRALDAGVQADSLKVDKKYLEDYLASLGQDSSNGKIDHPEVKQIVENQLARTRDKIISLAKDANNLNQEYLARKYSHIIKVIIPPFSYTHYPFNPVLIVFMTLIISFVFAVIIAYALEYSSRIRDQIL